MSSNRVYLEVKRIQSSSDKKDDFIFIYILIIFIDISFSLLFIYSIFNYVTPVLNNKF